MHRSPQTLPHGRQFPVADPERVQPGMPAPDARRKNRKQRESPGPIGLEIQNRPHPVGLKTSRSHDCLPQPSPVPGEGSIQSIQSPESNRNRVVHESPFAQKAREPTHRSTPEQKSESRFSTQNEACLDEMDQSLPLVPQLLMS